MSSEQQAATEPNGSATAHGHPATPSDLKAEIDREIEEKLVALSQKRGCAIYPLLLAGTDIGNDLVDDVFDDLRTKFSSPPGKLEVVLDSGGGSIHAAYNIGLLLRRFAPDELNFIVPRWAKSAATLLACSGNKILMTPVAEIGPIDPQITQMNPLEQRLEQFSPLDIEATLELIRNEFKSGEARLAKGLLERLQFPLTLGGFKKSLNIGKEYLRRLLVERMFKQGQDVEKIVDEIGVQLVEGYSDHEFCIDIKEAQKIGIVTEELADQDLDLVWSLFKLNKKKQRLAREEKEREMNEMLKHLPHGTRMSPRNSTEDRRIRCSTGDRNRQGDIMHIGQELASLANTDRISLAAKLAKEALRQKGEITPDHIKAIPFLSEKDVELVVDYLLRHCNVEVLQRKVESRPVIRWERFIRLKHTS